MPYVPASMRDKVIRDLHQLRFAIHPNGEQNVPSFEPHILVAKSKEGYSPICSTVLDGSTGNRRRKENKLLEATT